MSKRHLESACSQNKYPKRYILGFHLSKLHTLDGRHFLNQTWYTWFVVFQKEGEEQKTHDVLLKVFLFFYE